MTALSTSKSKLLEEMEIVRLETDSGSSTVVEDEARADGLVVQPLPGLNVTTKRASRPG